MVKKDLYERRVKIFTQQLSALAGKDRADKLYELAFEHKDKPGKEQEAIKAFEDCIDVFREISNTPELNNEAAIVTRYFIDFLIEKGKFKQARTYCLDHYKHFARSASSQYPAEQQSVVHTLARVFYNFAETTSDSLQKERYYNAAKKQFESALENCECLDRLADATEPKIKKDEVRQKQARALENLMLIKHKMKEPFESVNALADKVIEISLAAHDSETDRKVRISLVESILEDYTKELKVASDHVAYMLKTRDRWLTNLSPEEDVYLLSLCAKVKTRERNIAEASSILRKALKKDYPEQVREPIVKYLKSLSSLAKWMKKHEEVQADTYERTLEKIELCEKVGDKACAVDEYFVAKDYYMQWIKLLNDPNLPLTEKPVKLCKAYSSLALTHKDCNEFDLALQVFEKEFNLLKNRSSFPNRNKEMAKSCSQLAECCERLGNNDIAFSWYEMGIKCAEASNDDHIKSEMYKTMVGFLSTYQGAPEGLLSDMKAKDDEYDQYYLQESQEEEDEKERYGSEDEEEIVLSEEEGDSVDAVLEERQRADPFAFRLKNGKVRKNQKGETPLHDACIKGDVARVQKLLDMKHPLEEADYLGWTAFHEACNLDNVKIAQMLLDAGANINAKANDGITPLMDTATAGSFDTLRLLLNYGARTCYVDKEGKDALDHLEEYRIRNQEDPEVPVAARKDPDEFDEVTRRLKEQMRNEGCMEKHEQRKIERSRKVDRVGSLSDLRQAQKRKTNKRKSDEAGDTGLLKQERGKSAILTDYRNTIQGIRGRRNITVESPSPKRKKESRSVLMDGPEEPIPDIVADEEPIVYEDIVPTSMAAQRSSHESELAPSTSGRTGRQSNGFPPRCLFPSESSGKRGKKRVKRSGSGANLFDDSSEGLNDSSGAELMNDNVHVQNGSLLKPNLCGAVTINFEGKSFLVSLPDDPNATVQCFAEELAKRNYIDSAGKRGLPVYQLQTAQGIFIHSQEKTQRVLVPGHSYVAKIKCWKLPPIAEKYRKECASVGTEAFQNFETKLQQSQETGAFSFKNEPYLDSSSLKAIIKTLIDYAEKLTSLDFSDRRAEGASDDIFHLIKNSPNLTKLALKDTFKDYESFSGLLSSSEIPVLKNIRELDFSDSKTECAGCLTLITLLLNHCPSLEVFRLEESDFFNSADQKDLQQFSQSLKHCASLKHVSFAGLGEQALNQLEYLPTSVTGLDLCQCNINPSNAGTLSAALLKFPSLELLNVENNKDMGNKGTLRILNTLIDLRKQKLNLMSWSINLSGGNCDLNAEDSLGFAVVRLLHQMKTGKLILSFESGMDERELGRLMIDFAENHPEGTLKLSRGSRLEFCF